MSNIHITTLSGDTIALTDDRVNHFKEMIHGDVLFPSQEEYDQARKIWNGMIDTRPACIVQCSGPAMSSMR